jgi:hypothetical protein
LSKAERKEFCQFLHDLKVPSGYLSNFKRLVLVKDMKMNFNLMKSHDCHVLMTALLPVALRGIKTELVHDAVTSLSLFFNAIEQKVIDEEKLLDLERRLLTDKRRIPLRSASVRTPHLFHHGIPKVLVNPRSKGITSIQSTFTH